MSDASIGHLNTCAHPGCLCQVDPGEQYCGDYCRGRPRADVLPANSPRVERTQRCGCGHSACEESRA